MNETEKKDSPTIIRPPVSLKTNMRKQAKNDKNSERENDKMTNHLIGRSLSKLSVSKTTH